MKDNQLEQLKKDVGNIHITSSEKNTVREHLYAHMQSNPIQEKQVFISPLRMFSHAFHRHAFAYVLILGLATISVPTVYAAQKSLPGEFLYTLKTDIIEPTSEFLTIGDRARSTLITDHMQNRLEETFEILNDSDVEEKLSVVGKKLIDTTQRARKHVSESDTLSVEEKIEVQKDFLSIVEAQQEIVDDAGSSELSTLTDQNQNVLEEDLTETIEVYIEDATDEEMSNHLENAIDNIRKKLSTDITEEQRDILAEGVSESIDLLAEENMDDALQTLILHDQDADVAGIITKITATSTDSEDGKVQGETFNVNEFSTSTIE